MAKPGVEAHGVVKNVWLGPLMALVTALAATLAAFRQTALSIITIWNGSSTYSYGFVILPICALLVWREKDKLKALTPTPSLAGVALFFVSALLWLAGNVADVQLIQHIALVAMLDAMVWTLLGTRAVRVLQFPLFFLFFAVPVGDSLVPLLQRWTAAFTVNALRLSGIPAVQDGLVLSTPSGNWQVAQACSGIRYLIASLVIGVLVAGVAYKSWKRRIAFLLLSVSLPIVANAIRAYGIVLLAYLSGNALATGVDHVIYGFVFFSLLTAVLLTIALRWYEPDVPGGETQPAATILPASSTRLAGSWLVIVMIAFSAVALSGYLWSRTPATAPVSATVIHPAGWMEVNELDHEWAPDLESAHSRTIAAFVSGPREVSVYSATYSADRGGVELINGSNVVGNSAVWTLVASTSRQATISGRPVVVTENTIARGHQHRLVWSWYSIGDHLTSDAYRLRMIEAGDRLLGYPQSAALFAVSAPFNADPGEASQALSDFLK
jgi:exosortase A